MSQGQIVRAIEVLCARDHSPTTVGAVAAFTGLSREQVQEVARDLAASGLLCERAMQMGGVLCIRDAHEPIACRRLEAGCRAELDS